MISDSCNLSFDGISMVQNIEYIKQTKYKELKNPEEDFPERFQTRSKSRNKNIS